MKRSTFIGTTAAGAGSMTAAVAAMSCATDVVPGGTNLVERRANFDLAGFDRTLGRVVDYRLLYEAVTFVPSLLNNVKNSINGLQFGFDVDPVRIVTAIAGHGPSSTYAYSDAVIAKYHVGEYFGLKDPTTGEPLTKNIFLAKRATSASTDPDDEHGSYQDTSVEALQARGAIFLTCHTAVEEQARGIVKKGFAPSGMTASDVAVDMLTHLIPGAVVVPSMVATIAVLQTKYHYAYLTIA